MGQFAVFLLRVDYCVESILIDSNSGRCVVSRPKSRSKALELQEKFIKSGKVEKCLPFPFNRSKEFMVHVGGGKYVFRKKFRLSKNRSEKTLPGTRL